MVILAIFVLALSITACDDFFSSGWGSPREYQAENINVTIHNLDRWLERTVGNPPLARLVSENISKQVADPNHPYRGIFQRAGIRIAVESSGLGASLLSNAFNVLSDIADADDDQIEQKLKNVLSKVQDDFRSSGGVAAATNIATIAVDDITLSNGAPTFPSGTFVHETTPSEVAKAILVLTLAVVEENGMNVNDWNNFALDQIGLESNAAGIVVVDENSSATFHVLAAYLNLIAADNKFEGNFLTGAIRDAFLGN